MLLYFSAQISQEYSDAVRDLALSLSIPQKNIVFKTDGCPLGSLGVYIKFKDEYSLSLFKMKINESIPCIQKEW